MDQLVAGRVDRTERARWIASAGWLIIMLAAGVAALPIIGLAEGSVVIGCMLVLAELIEFWAGMFRRQTRTLAMIAGAITAVAGMLFGTDQATKFAAALIIVASWLLLRSLVLAIASALEYGPMRFWTGLAAAADFILALILLVGLSVSVLVISLFGPTEPIIARFAWIMAISFVATGTMLLEVARCPRREAA